MLEVSIAGVHYTKVIDDEGNGYVVGSITVDAVDVGTLVIIVLREELAELGIG